MVDTDKDLVAQADYILSIVPPRDAVSTAERFTKVAAAGQVRDKDQEPLLYIDLNAISPGRSQTLQTLLNDHPEMRFLDGGVSAPRAQSLHPPS